MSPLGGTASPLDTNWAQPSATPSLIPPSLAHGASGCGRHGHRQRCPPQAHVLVRTSFYFISAWGGNSARPRLRRLTRRLAASRKTGRLTMYGTSCHQRLHRSVDMTGALCPHMVLGAFSTLFGASKRVRPPRRRAPRGKPRRSKNSSPILRWETLRSRRGSMTS